MCERRVQPRRLLKTPNILCSASILALPVRLRNKIVTNGTRGVMNRPGKLGTVLVTLQLVTLQWHAGAK